MPRIGKPINPPGVPPTAKLSQAIQVGNLIFCSGQIGITPDGSMIGPGFEEQVAQAFENLKTVLGLAGANLSNVVKITSYLVDPEDRARYAEVRARYLEPPYPASTLVVVKRLAKPEYQFEIDAIAVLE